MPTAVTALPPQRAPWTSHRRGAPTPERHPITGHWQTTISGHTYVLTDHGQLERKAIHMIPNHHRNLRATFWESELKDYSHLPIVAWDSDGHPMVANSDELRLVRAADIPGFDGFALDADETTRTAY